jgi:MOSC domain-containing protein YiiM
MAVCISKYRGTRKINVKCCELIADYGLKNDAHAGKWNRQVSLLCYEKEIEFKNRGINIAPGAFGENLLVMGIDFKSLPVGTRLRCNSVLLEITQIGKVCHSECEIFKHVGDCIMPREGVFAKVLNGGIVSVGDELYVEQQKIQSGSSDNK